MKLCILLTPIIAESEFNSICLLDCVFVKAKKKAISVKAEANHVCFDSAGDVNTAAACV